MALRELLTALRALPDITAIRPGLGMASDRHWAEPSLWVVGPDQPTLDRLARRFAQLGYLHGLGPSPACLRLMPLK